MSTIGIIVVALVFAFLLAGYFTVKGGSANKDKKHYGGGGYHDNGDTDLRDNKDQNVE